MPSRAVREAASDGPPAPSTPPVIPKRRRTAPCRNSPAVPCNTLNEMEIESQWGAFLLLRAAAAVAFKNSR